MQDFPFAENAEVVNLIVRDLGRALLATPVLLLAVWRFRVQMNHGSGIGMLRATGSAVTAIGWVVYFLLDWVIPKPVAIDYVALQRGDPAMAWLAKGRIGYFDCTLKFSPPYEVAWSARKLATFTKNGERYLWIEGNADEPENVVASLKAAAKMLRVSVPTAAAVAAQVKVPRRNRDPMFAQATGSMEGMVFIFREPNELVTPVLLLRY